MTTEGRPIHFQQKYGINEAQIKLDLHRTRLKTDENEIPVDIQFFRHIDDNMPPDQQIINLGDNLVRLGSVGILWSLPRRALSMLLCVG